MNNFFFIVATKKSSFSQQINSSSNIFFSCFHFAFNLKKKKRIINEVHFSRASFVFFFSFVFCVFVQKMTNQKPEWKKKVQWANHEKRINNVSCRYHLRIRSLSQTQCVFCMFSFIESELEQQHSNWIDWWNKRAFQVVNKIACKTILLPVCYRLQFPLELLVYFCLSLEMPCICTFHFHCINM